MIFASANEAENMNDIRTEMGSESLSMRNVEWAQLHTAPLPLTNPCPVITLSMRLRAKMDRMISIDLQLQKDTVFSDEKIITSIDEFIH
jgi:hypothetical protein